MRRILVRAASYNSSMQAAPAPITSEFVFTNLPSSWGAFVLLAAAASLLYAVFALYRRESAECPPGVKWLLIALRSTATLLLAGIFLGPALVSVHEGRLEGTIVVLRDASQSMNTTDRYAQPQAVDLPKGDATARTHVVNLLLDADRRDWLPRLTKKGRIELADFTERLMAVTLAADEKVPPLQATGRSTDLAAAIRETLTSRRPAAIVVLTDGQHNAPEPVEPVAMEAQQQGVPLFFVGIGDAKRERRASVASVYSRPQAWQGEPFEIEAVVRFDNVEPGEARLELVEQRISADKTSPPPTSIVQTRQIQTPAGGSGQQTISLTHSVNEPGEYEYEVRIVLAGADQAPAQNSAHSNVVKVLNRERLRVLLVAGAPTWDYQLVQRLLARDKTLSLSCWLQTLDEGRAQDGNRPLTHLPKTREELFQYDVLVLLDPDPRGLEAEWMDLLPAFVGDHAGGLFYMAGPKYTARLLSEDHSSHLATLLPVTFGDLAAVEFAALLSGSNNPAWPLKVVTANADHPALRFFPDEQASLRAWESLPGVFWSFPCEAARPTAEALLVHSNTSLRGTEGPRPLMVAGRFGAGKTLYMGFSDTWRWRKAGHQGELFDKFWVQTVRYLAGGRSLAGHRRGTLETDHERYDLGEQVTLRARMLDASYQPLQAESLTATVRAPEQPAQEIQLLPVEHRPGTFAASFSPRHVGVHEVHIAMVGEAETNPVETSFRVELPSAETNQTWLNRPLLQELASLSGGRYFDWANADELPTAIPDRTQTVTTRSEPRPLWDNGYVLACLVGLVSAEWLLRKRFQLI